MNAIQWTNVLRPLLGLAAFGLVAAGCFHEEHFAPVSECPAHSTETADGCVCDEGYTFNGTFCITVSSDTGIQPADTGSDAVSPLACAGRSECEPGQACLGGYCSVNDDGFCADIEECPVGERCDETHVCVAVCSPECASDEACVDGVCVSTVESGEICDACVADADCAGDRNLCVALAGRTAFCSVDCSGAGSCPTGHTCQVVDTAGSQQCVPTAGAACEGCLREGCPEAHFCNALTLACEPFADLCEPCTAFDQCGPLAHCLSIGGAPHCLTECVAGCDDGFTCTTIGGRAVCAPDDGTCDDPGTCELEVTDCTGTTSILDATACRCVGCLDEGDCDSGQLCSDTGTCLNGSSTCSSTAECGGGYCQSGVCIECLGNSDCDGQPCIAGACLACECPAGQRCSPVDGSCEEIPATGDCETDTECIQAAQALGHDGSGVSCDPNVGCFVAGACGGTDAMGQALTDGVFDAPCPIGLTCESSVLEPGAGMCSGCDVSNPNSCRLGETCLDFLGTPVCNAGLGF